MSDPMFVIDNVEYPVPHAFNLADPVLVSEVTGLDWMDFAELLDDGSNDPRALAGLIAVAVWHANPGWKRDRVARFVEQIGMDKIDVKGGDDTGNPPVPESDTTGSSPEASVPVPEPDSDSTQPITGVPV